MLYYSPADKEHRRSPPTTTTIVMTSPSHLATPAPLAPLVEFERPPVEEVVLGAQFAPVVGLGIKGLAAFCQGIATKFPQWTQTRPLARRVEQFGGPDLFDGGNININLNDFAGVRSRMMLASADDTRLLQVQDDVFVRNWRRRPADHDSPYPRFGRLTRQFANDLSEFLGFIEEQGLRSPQFDQGEVTYVNHIRVAAQDHDLHKHPERALRHLQAVPTAHPALEQEEGALDVSWRFHWRDGPNASGPAGRLRLNVRPMLLAGSGEKILRATLVARGRPRGLGVAGLAEWQTLAHDVLVTTFAAVTTNEYHRHWGVRHAER